MSETETHVPSTEPAPAPEETTVLKTELDAMQERLREAQERQLRAAAEFDNFRKRAAREREETVKLANERLLRELLPVVDNLERALGSGGETGALVEGVRLVHKQFVDALGRCGVKAFPSLGEKFDPTRHEALMQQETDQVPPDHVLAELVKGYVLNDKLVRPASVVVAKAPAAPAAEA